MCAALLFRPPLCGWARATLRCATQTTHPMDARAAPGRSRASELIARARVPRSARGAAGERARERGGVWWWAAMLALAFHARARCILSVALCGSHGRTRGVVAQSYLEKQDLSGERGRERAGDDVIRSCVRRGRRARPSSPERPSRRGEVENHRKQATMGVQAWVRVWSDVRSSAGVTESPKIAWSSAQARQREMQRGGVRLRSAQGRQREMQTPSASSRIVGRASGLHNPVRFFVLQPCVHGP